MFRRLQALFTLAVVGLGFGGCASDDPPEFQSGVDGNTQLANLTPEQKITICKNQAAFVHTRVDTTSLTRFLCAFTPAVFGAADDTACEAAMADCVGAFAVKVDVAVAGPNAVPAACLLAPLGQCSSGTVGAYETCVESLADVQIQIGTDFSCGKRHQYADGPTVGVSACDAVGPACTSAAEPAVIR